MTSTDTRHRIAVFIDFDNVEIGVKSTIGQQFDIGLVLEAIKERGVDWVVEQYQRLRGSKVYVSFDIDAVDPAYAPGTGTPEVGGLTAYEALALVRGLRGLDFAGFDIVEVAPQYDGPGQITALLAANLLFEFLSLVALNR